MGLGWEKGCPEPGSRHREATSGDLSEVAAMCKTVKAVIEPDGTVRFLEPIYLKQARNALVTILDEPVDESEEILALVSEEALSDWAREEEEEAWSHLQQEP